MKNIFLTESQMKIIRDSITPLNNNGEEPLDRFQGMSDDEFISTYDDPEEGEIMRQLMNLADEGSSIFNSMKDAIEASPYYQNNADKMKIYLDRIEEINDKIADLWH